jgi:thiosulfate dehydrogenase [quinone] large subunit
MTTKTSPLAKHVAIFRIVFGVVWAIDATFKWLPSFRSGFLGQITAAAQGQPSWLAPWFNFWVRLLSHNPQLFAVLTAIIESLIAIALIFGLARRLTYCSAIVFTLMIWGIAEGFGGPYNSGSTDIGTAIIYAIVFFALYGLERLAVKPVWTVDNYISRKLKWWNIIANP